MEPSVNRNVNGYPLLSDGTIDWEKTSEEKQAYLNKYEAALNLENGTKKVRKVVTNFTPPKKKRKKRK